MTVTLKSLICLIFLFLTSQVFGSELVNFQNISVRADQVTLDENSNQLSLSGNLKIDFGNLTITGKTGLLDLKKESLLILGKPASIFSMDQTIHGKADRLIIFPNLSIEMTGDAELFSEDRSIFSQNITYQINVND